MKFDRFRIRHGVLIGAFIGFEIWRGLSAAAFNKTDEAYQSARAMALEEAAYHAP